MFSQPLSLHLWSPVAQRAPASSLLSLLFPSQFSIPVALAAVICEILVPVVTGPLSPDSLCQVGFPVCASTGLRQREYGAWSVSTYLAGPPSARCCFCSVMDLASTGPWPCSLQHPQSDLRFLFSGSEASLLALQSRVAA